MEVTKIEKISTRRFCEVRATITSETFEEPFILWYRFPRWIRKFINVTNGTPFLAALLLPSMRTGEPLKISYPVSADLLSKVDKIQTIYHQWDPTLSIVNVNAPVDKELPRIKGERLQTGLFFSLGVDSFYTLLKEQEKITHLLIVHGFDIFLGKHNTKLFPKVYSNVKKVAKVFDKKVIFVATNLRELSDQFVSWPKLHHGAAMASVGLHLQYLLQTIFIASTYPYEQLHPHGSHPELDPLWSTEYVSFVHHGCEARRIDKIHFIANTPIVLKTLRVCWINPNNEYNCGRCEKCLRTMIGLYIAGVLERCETFPHDIDPELVRNMTVDTTGDFLSELAETLDSSERDLILKTALREAISKNRGREHG